MIGSLLSGVLRLELQESGIQTFPGLAAMIYGISDPAATLDWWQLYILSTKAHALA